MKRNIYATIIGLSLLLFSAPSALAVKQLPNAEVNLGLFNIVSFETWNSNYCTATQSHINIRVDTTSGSASAILQYRTTNGAWKYFGSTWETIPKKTSHTFNMNAKKGDDYRVLVKANLLTAKGQVNCW